MKTKLKRFSDLNIADPKCKICKGEGWVCEDHSLNPWGEGNGCCGAAGMPCKCNGLSKAEKK